MEKSSFPRSSWRFVLKIAARATARYCWKFRIAGEAASSAWSTAAIGMLRSDAGDGWLLRNGYTIVSLGWQWDAAGKGALRFFAPVAKE